MKIVVVRAPAVDAIETNPLLPYITGRLREDGFTNVTQRDLGPECMEHVLSPSYLNMCLTAVEQELRRLDSAPELTPPDQTRYGNLARAALQGPTLAAMIEDAKTVLRTPEQFQNLSLYHWAVETVQNALNLVSQRHNPGAYTAFDFRTRLYGTPDTVEDLVRAASTGDHPFRDPIEQATAEIAAQAPDMVVLESAYKHQLVPALMIAHGLRRRLGDRVSIAFHGDYALAGIDLEKTGPFFTLVNLLVLSPFPNVADAYAAAGIISRVAELIRSRGRLSADDLDGFTNVVYCDDRTGQIITTPLLSVDANRPLPTPVFDGLPMDLYLSPHKLATVALNRGCYWKKCAFCVRRDDYVKEDVSHLLTVIGDLYQQGFRHFKFTNDSNPPPLWRALAEGILAAGWDIRWYGFARLEKGFTHELFTLLHKAGCRTVWFGLESAAPRVLELMDKGTTPASMREVIENAHAGGIGVVVSGFTGFPTETEAEALQTRDFLIDLQGKIVRCSMGIYVLQKQTPVFDDPSQFDVLQIQSDRGHTDDSYYFEASAGMDRNAMFDVHAKVLAGLDEVYSGQMAEVIDRTTQFFHYSYSSHLAAHLDEHGVDGMVATAPPPVAAVHSGSESLRLDQQVGVQPWINLLELRYDMESLLKYAQTVADGNVTGFVGLSTSAEAMSGPSVRPLPAPVWLLYNGRSHELSRVSPFVARLITRCRSAVPYGELMTELTPQAAQVAQRGLPVLVERQILTLI